MHRTEAAGNVAGLYSNGNPALSQPATIVEDTALNAFQEELVNLVLGSGLTLLTTATDNYTQVLEAVNTLITSGGVQVKQSLDNDSGPLDLGGIGLLEFDPSVVLGVTARVHIIRRTDSDFKIEMGTLTIIRDTENNAWRKPIFNSDGDDAGVGFTMGSVASGANSGFGKIQYTTDDLAGTTYSGIATITDVKIFK